MCVVICSLPILPYLNTNNLAACTNYRPTAEYSKENNHLLVHAIRTVFTCTCIDFIYCRSTIFTSGREREMFYLTTHSTHFIYSYMASDIWLRTILIVRKETCCRHIGYSYQLTARDLLYVPSHRHDNTYHSLCYTSRGALDGARNS